ncbi:MAG: VCBS repeat-containing protein, partial [Bacteroidetes bacterium]|nr:VCBS repeat-containing protein [Bacteroidota bacterium]
VGDINNDGHLDIYITNLYENTLMLTNGDKTFTEISNSAGVTDYGMGWGTGFYDVDNDGWQDVYVANTPNYPNIMYQNLGNNAFIPVSENTVLSSEGSGFGVAGADIDHDGKIDLFVANSNDKTGNQLFWNQSNSLNHWLEIKPEGVISNRSGIGVRVIAKAGEKIFIDELNSGSGYAGQNSLIMHLGLGEITQLDTLKILWPSGVTDVILNVKTDQYLSIKEGSTGSQGTSDPLPKGLTLAPNPFDTHLEISYWFQQKNTIDFTFTDLTGRVIAEEKHLHQEPGKYTLFMNTHALNPGIYMGILNIGGEKFYQKIIKK